MRRARGRCPGTPLEEFLPLPQHVLAEVWRPLDQLVHFPLPPAIEFDSPNVSPAICFSVSHTSLTEANGLPKTAAAPRARRAACLPGRSSAVIEAAPHERVHGQDRVERLRHYIPGKFTSIRITSDFRVDERQYISTASAPEPVGVHVEPPLAEFPRRTRAEGVVAAIDHEYARRAGGREPPRSRATRLQRGHAVLPVSVARRVFRRTRGRLRGGRTGVPPASSPTFGSGVRAAAACHSPTSKAITVAKSQRSRVVTFRLLPTCGTCGQRHDPVSMGLAANEEPNRPTRAGGMGIVGNGKNSRAVAPAAR